MCDLWPGLVGVGVSGLSNYGSSFEFYFVAKYLAKSLNLLGVLYMRT